MATHFSPSSVSGGTFIGGQPLVARVYGWPKVDGRELPFLAQIDLGEVEEDDLPVDGRLHIFVDLVDLAWHVHYDPGASSPLQPLWPVGPLIEDGLYDRTDLRVGGSNGLIQVGGEARSRDSDTDESELRLCALLGANGLDPYGDWREDDPVYARVLALPEDWRLIAQLDIQDDLDATTRLFVYGERTACREGRFGRTWLVCELDPKFD